MKKFVFASFAVCLFMACSTDDDDLGTDPGNDNEPVADCNVIEVSGTIDEPTVWEEGYVYVINGSDLSVQSVLTIEPGVVVKIRNARISIYEEGKIIAEGTADKHIVFTSLADDRYCGDTNGDAVATTPEKGDWEELDLHGTVGSIFKYVDVFYAGQNGGRAVEIGWPQSASFTFDHCRIAHTLYQQGPYSYAFDGKSSMKDASVSKFTNNALYDNGRPIYFNTFYQLDPSNVFHNPEDPTVTNTLNGIYLSLGSSAGNNGESVNWNNTEVPYVSDAVSATQVHNSATINIGPNAIVKFINTGGGLQSSNGSVNLDSAAILTSYKDDVHGGDTNGDGNTTSSATGDWAGFRITNTGTTSYWEQGPNILYAEN